jgi:phage shock protein E
VWSFFKSRDVSNHRELVRNGALLLDVRTPAEFASGHVDGATNIAVDELPRRIAELGNARTIVIYCRSGARSARAAQLLRAHGHEAHDIGGMGNW